MNKKVDSQVQHAFNEIFRHHQELQNWFSSSWWFFLLLPEQEEGYGPKQLMFTFASRIGEVVGVGDDWNKGVSLERPNAKIDHFPTQVAGWINDGTTVHDRIVFTNAQAELNYEKQYNRAWNGKYGGEIKASKKHPIGVDCNFIGERGYGKFSVWAEDLDNELETPQVVSVMGPKKGALGNVHSIAWRKFTFTGEFKSPTGVEQLSGHGYFQRVLMNIPLLSWMWSYIIFADGSVFSSFMLYFGPNTFKRKIKFFKQTIERIRYNIRPSAYFYDNQKKELIYFDTARIIPKLTDEEPEFYAEARTNSGDVMRLKIGTHNKKSFSLNRRVFKMMWETRYLWTEYMTRVEKLRGKINGHVITEKDLGEGWGNMEYSFGISL